MKNNIFFEEQEPLKELEDLETLPYSNECEIDVYGEKTQIKEFESIVRNEHIYGIEIIGKFDIEDFQSTENSLLLDADSNGDIISNFFFEKQCPLNKALLENPVKKGIGEITLESYQKLMQAIYEARFNKNNYNVNSNESIYKEVFLNKKIDLIMASLIFNLRIVIENKDSYDLLKRKVITENGLIIENTIEDYKQLELPKERYNMVPIQFLD